jgi:peptide/nickel transport system substrate-binding protein
VNANLDTTSSGAARHRRLFRTTLVSAIAVATAISLVACSTEASEEPGTATATAGGSLNVAIDADPVCLDPAQATLIASNVVSRQVVDSLVDQDPETGEFSPWLASSWEINDDASAYTFTLVDGVTFSDGEVLDASAVKTAFDAIVALGARSPFGGTYFSGYVGTTVIDPLTVEVAFDSPNAQFLMAASSTTLGIQSPGAMAATPEERCAGTAIVGSGPFTIDSYTPNQSVHIVNREDYDWPSGLAEHGGAAYLDDVTYTVATEPSVRSGSLASGQVDMATTIQPQDEAQFDGNGFSLLTRTNPGVVIGMSPDLTHSTILQDEDVRQAIQMGIDREEIAEVVLTPSYGVATGILGNTTPGWSDAGDLLAYDPDAAGDLLDDAGWEMGDDGIREKDGEKLAISIAYFYQTNVVEYTQQQLRKIGVDLVLNEMTAAQYTSSYKSGNTDMISTSVSRPDPDILRAVFSPITGITNLAFLTPEDAVAQELEPLFDSIRSTTDVDSRAETAAEAQDILLENNLMFPLSQLTQVIGVSDSVTGVRYDAASRFMVYDASITE